MSDATYAEKAHQGCYDSEGADLLDMWDRLLVVDGDPRIETWMVHVMGKPKREERDEDDNQESSGRRFLTHGTQSGSRRRGCLGPKVLQQKGFGDS